MERKYKYMPEDFEDENDREDLENLYEAIEVYRKDKSNWRNRAKIDSLADLLNLSLKIDVSDGRITKEYKDEFFEYIKSLLYD